MTPGSNRQASCGRILQVFLPLLSTVWWAYRRREQALTELAEGTATYNACQLSPVFIQSAFNAAVGMACLHWSLQ